MTETTHNNALPAGYQLHWYTIQSVLGQGAFGITYLAHDINLDRLVAIKEYMPGQFSMRGNNQTIEPISDDLNSDYQSGLERFLSEARILTMFQHPNLVQVFNIFQQNNTAYMVMSYESGKSLKQILKSRKQLSELELMRILVPLLDGIEMMHKKGFIHRDIKPGNIFIRTDHSPVLLDFGSARQTHYYFSEDEESPVKTLTNFVSPGYTPIEQYTGKSDRQGPWTDIYSLGATLYKSIIGKMPIEAVERSESLLHVEKDEYQPLVRLVEGEYSKSFLSAIDHALCFKAQDRPQSIPEWKKEFGITEDDIDTIEIPGYQLQKIHADYESIDTQEITTRANHATTQVTDEVSNTGSTGNSAGLGQQPSLYHRILQTMPYAAAAMVILAIIIRINLQQAIPDSTTETPTTHHVEVTKPDTKPVATEKTPSEPSTTLIAGLQTKQFFHDIPAVTRQIDEETDQPDKQESEISQLLSKAADNIQQNQLTVPDKNNAVYHYTEILKIDPNNTDAQQGLLLITDKFMIKAYRAIENNQFSKANDYINKADTITPGVGAIARAREYLALKQRQQQKRIVVATQTKTPATVTHNQYDKGIKVVDLSRDVPHQQKDNIPDNDIDRTLNAIENLLQ